MNQGARGAQAVNPAPWRARPPAPAGTAAARGHGAARRTLSFIRTVTVGSGIAPDLLTLGGHGLANQALAGSCREGRYRRWGVSPRPENAALQ